MYYSIYKLMERAGLKDTVETIFIAFFFKFSHSFNKLKTYYLDFENFKFRGQFEPFISLV